MQKCLCNHADFLPDSNSFFTFPAWFCSPFVENSWQTNPSHRELIAVLDQKHQWRCLYELHQIDQHWDFRGTTVIPSSVTALGDGAFLECIGLMHSDIPPTIARIGNDTFNSCYYLESINLSSALKSIGNYVRAGCEKIVSSQTTALPLSLMSPP